MNHVDLFYVALSGGAILVTMYFSYLLVEGYDAAKRKAERAGAIKRRR